MMVKQLVFPILAALGFSSPAIAAPAPKIWRLDCGELQMNDMSPLSDAGDYDGKSTRLVVSCYLIRYGDDYLLWDAGLPLSVLGKEIDPKAPISPTLRADLPTQLARIGVAPSKIKWIGLSHYHFDHTGQVAAFPQATLLIGAADWRALKEAGTPSGADKTLLTNWLTGSGKVDPVSGDRDLFGDGSVVLLAAPGHTPGSMALLVRLANSGPVIISGDVLHLEAQWPKRAVPTWNTDRADSLASMERLERLAANLTARLIVEHDPADVTKLAAFPAASD